MGGQQRGPGIRDEEIRVLRSVSRDISIVAHEGMPSASAHSFPLPPLNHMPPHTPKHIPERAPVSLRPCLLLLPIFVAAADALMAENRARAIMMVTDLAGHAAQLDDLTQVFTIVVQE